MISALSIFPVEKVRLLSTETKVTSHVVREQHIFLITWFISTNSSLHKPLKIIKTISHDIARNSIRALTIKIKTIQKI